MKQHQYRITVEHLADAKGNPSTYDAPLVFETGNHDDIFKIVGLMTSRDDLTAEQATSLAVGLKLFSEVMLENKGHELFKDFQPHFLGFMKTLKGK